MASPQKENGHLDLANEIVEALAKTQLSGYEWRIIMAILRKTYSWHKKEDWISFSQFREMTEIKDDAHISRNIKKLIEKQIVAKTGKFYSFNKDYEHWKKLPKYASEVAQIGKSKLPKLADTKETITKETITKENITNVIVAKPQYGNQQLNELINFSKELNFPLQGSQQINRFNASNLLKKFGLDKSKKLVEAACKCRGKPYAPVISDFIQLYRKVGDLITFYHKDNKRKKIFKVS